MTTTSSNMPPALSHKAPASSIETARETARRARPALAALVGAAAALALSIPRTASAGLGTPRGTPASPRAQAPHEPAAPPRAIAAARMFAQTLAQNDDDGGGDATADKGASPEQIEKYVAVYRAMQRNHNLTVEQAAAAQGLTVGAFRELERRIESDDAARDAARNALAAPAQSATPAATPTAQR